MFEDWLNDYWAGLQPEHPDLLPAGTPFQRLVWAETKRIAYGETITYGQLSHRIGRPAAVRAVARALGANPWLIVIPCHRVVAKNGLGGYRGGPAMKQRLLDHEKTTHAE